MVVQTSPAIIYPDCDGNPMSDNTKQFRWIVTIKENLDLLFADNPDVFVAGDLLWYPVEGSNTIRVAPDAMVVFGRAKGDRGDSQGRGFQTRLAAEYYLPATVDRSLCHPWICQILPLHRVQREWYYCLRLGTTADLRQQRHRDYR